MIAEATKPQTETQNLPALVVHQPQQTAVVRSMDDVERAAKAMTASGFFADTKQAAQAVVKILAGQELGFGPFASMTGVHVIQNKPVLAANLMAAAVKRTGKYNYRVLTLTDDHCEIAFFEGGKEVGRSAFSMHDAEQAGLPNKDNWKKYPRNMLFARALSNGQKWYCPDVFNGATVYTPDEMGATVDAEGYVIETPAPTPQAEATATQQAAPAPKPNPGKFPRNDAEQPTEPGDDVFDITGVEKLSYTDKKTGEKKPWWKVHTGAGIDFSTFSDTHATMASNCHNNDLQAHIIWSISKRGNPTIDDIRIVTDDQPVVAAKGDDLDFTEGLGA